MEIHEVTDFETFYNEYDATDPTNHCKVYQDVCECGNLQPTNSQFQTRILHRKLLIVWNEAEFFLKFRLQKSTVLLLFDRLRPVIADIMREDPNRDALEITCNGTMKAILITLHFLAGHEVAELYPDLNEALVRVNLKIASEAILFFRDMYISMPATGAEVAAVHQQFLEVAGFPRVLGVVGELRIMLDIKDEAAVGLRRSHCFHTSSSGKSFYSVTMAIVAGPNLKVMKTGSLHPGSKSSSRIYLDSQLKKSLEAGHWGDSFILGGDEYQCYERLLTPSASANSPEKKAYNESLEATREAFTNTITAWQQRFPILTKTVNLKLQSAVQVRSSLERFAAITAILHNFALVNNEPVPPVDPNLKFPKIVVPEGADFYRNELVLLEGHPTRKAMRNDLINNYFAPNFVKADLNPADSQLAEL